MRTLLIILAVGLLSPLSLAHASPQFEEGLHYHRLTTPATESPSIIEFFSFYCGSCYQHQRFNQRIEAKWPGILTKYHVTNLTPRNLGAAVQQAWATAQMLEIEQPFSHALFERNFVHRQQVTSEQSLHAVFEEIGADIEQVEATLASFQVRSLVRRMQQQEALYEVAGTPTYIVNGQYMMDIRAFRNSADFFSDYLALAEYLLEK